MTGTVKIQTISGLNNREKMPNKPVEATAISRQIESESCAPPPHLLRSAKKFMSHNDKKALEDAELTEGLFERDAQEVVTDFGGHTISSLRTFLAERGDSMDLMFSYSIISGQGFAHFLPSIDDYARSPESESDCGLPGPFADAVKNQLRNHPVAVFAVQDQVESLTKYLLDHLVKFDEGEEWEHETADKLRIILEILRRNKIAE